MCASRLSKRRPFSALLFDVAAAALLLAVFLRAARLRRQRREAPVRGEREIDVVAVGIEEAGAHDGGFEIVVADDRRHAAEVAERALVQPEKRLELLIPDRFLVAVPRVAQRHAKHPRPAPLAGRGVERRRAAEEIHLRFGPGRAVKDADGPARRRDRPHEPFHRFVARAVAVLLDQVLPDPLQAQAGVELLGDRRRDRPPRRTAGAAPSRGTFWPGLTPSRRTFWPHLNRRRDRHIGGIRWWRRIRAGERFGRICLAGRVVPAHRFAAHAGLGFDAAVAPAELEKGENLRFLRHLQVVRHRHPRGNEPSRMPEHPYLQWPVFRRSVVAAFQRSLTLS